MAIIKDVLTASKYINIPTTYKIQKLPDMDVAAERYLIPLIGAVLYKELNDAVAGNTGTVLESELMNKCRAVIVPGAFMSSLARANVQITDAGLRVAANDSMQAVSRWSFLELRNELADQTAFAQEALLSHLFANKGIYPTWVDSDEFKKLNDLVIASGSEFSDYYFLKDPHRVFWLLKDLIRDVQQLYLDSAMGGYYKVLKAKAQPTQLESDALVLIKHATAKYAILRACTSRAVRFDEDGFTVQMSAANNDNTQQGSQDAPDAKIGQLMALCERDADSYLVKLKELLNTNASADVFPEYFASPFYVSPKQQALVPNPNSRRKGVFGL